MTDPFPELVFLSVLRHQKEIFEVREWAEERQECCASRMRLFHVTPLRERWDLEGCQCCTNVHFWKRRRHLLLISLIKTSLSLFFLKCESKVYLDSLNIILVFSWNSTAKSLYIMYWHHCTEIKEALLIYINCCIFLIRKKCNVMCVVDVQIQMFSSQFFN